MKTLTAAIPFFALVSAIPALAGIPDAVTYAGTLNQGSAPANGTFTVVLGLFDAAADGNRVYQQTETSLPVSQGELVVDLGADPLNPLSDEILKGGPLFLDIIVNGEELTPRVPFTSVPFARVAKQAEHAAKADDADTVGGLGVDDILNVLTADGGVQRIADKFSLAPSGVTSAHILDGTITTADMAQSSIGSTQLADGSVATADIADRAITAAKLGAVSVGGAALINGSVNSDKLASAAVTSSRIADGAVTSAKVHAGVNILQEPAGCGSHLILQRGGGARAQCPTLACGAHHHQYATNNEDIASKYFNCAGDTCLDSNEVPDLCDIPDAVVGVMVGP